MNSSLVMKCVAFASKIPHLKRSMSTESQIKITSLMYSENGEPAKVLKKHEQSYEFDNVAINEVLVKMLAAPINPADINTIQGKYPVKPTLPSVPGNEGVAEVMAVGAGVTNLEPGDRVVPLKNALGTWRTHAFLPAAELFKVPKSLDIAAAASLTVNPCTAYRMLKDFVELEKGDTVLQNGANSAVGQNVIQLCRAWGLRSVNIVRNRPAINDLKDHLENIGADLILTEEELRKTDIFKIGEFDRPKLILNCIGGKNLTEMVRHVDHGGIVVTYGGMSLQPVIVPTSVLIFKDICLRGFWMTRWSKDNAHSEERTRMLHELIDLMTRKELTVPVHTMIPFHEYQFALDSSIPGKGMAGKKFILTFQD